MTMVLTIELNVKFPLVRSFSRVWAKLSLERNSREAFKLIRCSSTIRGGEGRGEEEE